MDREPELVRGPALTGVLLAVWAPVRSLSPCLRHCSSLRSGGQDRGPSVPPARAPEGSPLGDLLGGSDARARAPAEVGVLLMGASFVMEGALDVLLVVLAFKMLGSAARGWVS